ncbi:hypothetical protein LZ575_19320 [Antarcticibacterium sp. 1MA-6-2]|uniref:hypothetical protein n=1 Tax=Antarcticibacterium sp. 1MA-6-2 TaxID=2908210 RepID=UPI001F33C165|nr:hypothetical protein [Antarcticibacterium sp. 1MA-6-2]UJH90848.1 hypothetical protein LZ575_19320 [Antarcticibacterium sp. 1MA-6-2]
MINLKKHTNIALGYFLLVGILGIFLRLFFVTPIPANFRYIVHTHSHIALLGWVYIGLISLIYKMYLTETENTKTYRKLFWFTNITLLGMLFSFPFQGYALFSITFSTLFLIASYWLAWFFFKKVPLHHKRTYSWKCIKASLIYLIISSIGPWAIGGVMATLGNTSIWYKLSIYFYLHFQYNGWFILALCGILFFLMERSGIAIKRESFQKFFLLLNTGIVLSFFLSVLWVDPPVVFYLLAAAGAIFQAWAFWKFFNILKIHRLALRSLFSPFALHLLHIAGIILIFKIVLQLISAIPYFAQLSFLFTDFVIGYLHLVFLGLISITLFAFLISLRLLRMTRSTFTIYIIGFILSEVLIFYKGTALWLSLPFFTEYFLILALVSSLIPVSVGILLFRNLKIGGKKYS